MMKRILDLLLFSAVSRPLSSSLLPLSQKLTTAALRASARPASVNEAKQRFSLSSKLLAGDIANTKIRYTITNYQSYVASTKELFEFDNGHLYHHDNKQNHFLCASKNDNVIGFDSPRLGISSLRSGSSRMFLFSNSVSKVSVAYCRNKRCFLLPTFQSC
jgi:hypothetical protein